MPATGPSEHGVALHAHVGADKAAFHDECVCHSTPKASAGTADVAAAIRRQVEFYFSDANMPSDKQLLKLVQQDPEGWVPVAVIASFKRIKALSKEPQVVAEALRSSADLVVSAGGESVRRLAPLPEIDVEAIQRRTLVVEQLPATPTIESVTALFSPFGDVRVVRICSKAQAGRLPSWLAGAVHMVNWSEPQFALVELGDEEQAAAAVERARNAGDWRRSLRCRRLLQKPRPASHSGCPSGEARSGSRGGGSASSSGGNTGTPPPRHSWTSGDADGKSAAAAGGADAYGLPRLPPVRTRLGPSDAPSTPVGAQRGRSSCAGAGAGAAGSGAAASSVRALGVGGAICSPRVCTSPAAPALAARIDQILAAPTATGSPSADTPRGAPRSRIGSSGGGGGSSGGSEGGSGGGSGGGAGSATPTRLALASRTAGAAMALAAAAAAAAATSATGEASPTLRGPGPAPSTPPCRVRPVLDAALAAPPGSAPAAAGGQLRQQRPSTANAGAPPTSGGSRDRVSRVRASAAMFSDPGGPPVERGDVAGRGRGLALASGGGGRGVGEGAGGARAGTAAPGGDDGGRQRQRRRSTGDWRQGPGMLEPPEGVDGSGRACEGTLAAVQKAAASKSSRKKDKDKVNEQERKDKEKEKKDKDKQVGKKDYANWAAATPKYRAEAGMAKRISGSGEGCRGSMQGGSPRPSPLRRAGGCGGGEGGAAAGEEAVRVPRMPDGSRGFCFGRGRPLAPPPRP